jgi:hypothetical protein
MAYNTKMYWGISVAKGFVRKLNVFLRIFEVILPSALPFWLMQLAFFCGKGSISVQEFLHTKNEEGILTSFKIFMIKLW